MISISYSDIWAMCLKLSSFEGRTLTDGQGNTLYAQVHFTDQDKPFVHKYIREGAQLLASTLSRAISDLSVTDDTTETKIVVGGDPVVVTTSGKVDITFIDEERMKIPESALLVAILSSYVMSQWLSDKSVDRCKYYTELVTDQLKELRSWCVKKRPTLES